MKLYRCVNEACPSPGDFEADNPVCPACRGGLVMELVPVHYLVPADGPIATMLGPRMVACSPKMAKLPRAATVERLAVTCPRCRESDIFKEDERDGIDNHVPFIERKIAAEHGKPVSQG